MATDNIYHAYNIIYGMSIVNFQSYNWLLAKQFKSI